MLISEDHHALLTDFGLALRLIEIRSKSTYSQNIDRQRGSLLWMAPEVLKGASPDMRADIYSLGMTIWEVSIQLWNISAALNIIGPDI